MKEIVFRKECLAVAGDGCGGQEAGAGNSRALASLYSSAARLCAYSVRNGDQEERRKEMISRNGGYL